MPKTHEQEIDEVAQYALKHYPEQRVQMTKNQNHRIKKEVKKLIKEVEAKIIPNKIKTIMLIN